MIEYYTKEHIKIEIGSIYSIDQGIFKCLAFKKEGQLQPIVGLVTLYDGTQIAWSAHPIQLSHAGFPDAFKKSSLMQENNNLRVYDPADMWVLYVENAYGVYEVLRFVSPELAKEYGNNSTTINPFAIAKVGQKFQRGDGL